MCSGLHLGLEDCTRDPIGVQTIFYLIALSAFEAPRRIACNAPYSRLRADSSDVNIISVCCILMRRPAPHTAPGKADPRRADDDTEGCCQPPSHSPQRQQQQQSAAKDAVAGYGPEYHRKDVSHDGHEDIRERHVRCHPAAVAGCQPQVSPDDLFYGSDDLLHGFYSITKKAARSQQHSAQSGSRRLTYRSPSCPGTC